MTLITLSKIKRVCALALVPRVFRGDGCTPGKFHRLNFNGTQKARKSTVSDDSKDKELIRCKRCKRIIEYAFGPPEVFTEKDKAANIPHVNLYAKPDLQKEPQQGEATENNEMPAEVAQKFKEAGKDKNSVTLLEDLKSKTLAQAKANMLLRARDVDMVLAGMEKKEKSQDDTKGDNNDNLKQDVAIKNQESESGGQAAAKDEALKSNAKAPGGQEINTIMHSSATERGKYDEKYLANEITHTSIEESKKVNEATHSNVGFSNSIAESKKADATFLANAIESLKLESNPKLARSKQINASMPSTAMEREDSTTATEASKNATLQATATSNQKIASNAQTKQDDASNEVEGKKESSTLHATATKNKEFEPQEEKNVQVKIQDMTIAENREQPITFTTSTEQRDAKTMHASSTQKGEYESIVNATNTTEHTSAAMEKERSKLQSTTASKETDGKLRQQTEEINTPPLITGTKPKSDITNPPLTIGPGFINITPNQTAAQAMEAQIFDDIAKKYLGSSAKQIDNQLVDDMKQVNFQSNVKDEVMKQVNVQSNVKDDVMRQINVQSNVKDEVIAQAANQCSEEQTPKHAPLEQRTSKDNSLAELSTQGEKESVTMASEIMNMEYDRGTILNEGYACEPLEPVVDSRILHMSNVRSGQELYEKNEEEFRLEPEHRHPYHLLQTALIDSVNPAAPKKGVLIREYPTSFMAEPEKYTTPFDSPMPEYEWKYRGQSVTHNYTAASKGPLEDQGYIGDVYMKAEEKEALKSTAEQEAIEQKDLGISGQQAQAGAMENGSTHQPLTQSQGANESWKGQETGAKVCSNLEKHETLQPTAGRILPKNEAEAIKPKDLGLGEQQPSQAVEMAQNFIQPLSRSQEPNEGVPLTGTVIIDATLPEINLNDESVPLTEILRRVRERSRIMYCREIGIEMAKNFTTLNPEGKCGDKKPECPPPAPTCPPPKCPPPPQCPPPPCPKPCAPPPPKCPPPVVPKSPCAKYQAQDAVSLALHLGPIINTPRKVLMPVLVSNYSLPSTETESSKWRFVIREKLLQLRRVLHSIFEQPGPSSIERLKVFGSRDYTPWTPIPSWPYPVAQKKPRLQCPKEGCPFAPPPKIRPPCLEKPCTGFPKRLSFSNML